MRKLAAFCVLLFAIGLSCRSSGHSSASLPQSLTNADVSWDGTPFGLEPRLSDAASNVLMQGSAAVSGLREALNDSGRVVVAHVILTKMRREPFEVSGSQWNGLQVDLFADGRVEYDRDNLKEVQSHWRRVLSAAEEKR